MLIADAPEDLELDPLPQGCRVAAEIVLQVFVKHAAAQGWEPATAAMALADAADELILMLAQSRTLRH